MHGETVKLTLFDILEVVKVVPNMAKYIFTAY